MNKNPRLLSLDVFRGMTIMLMIVVNNPGSWSYVFAPLRHSKWNGCTPTDLVFPFFMFIMGVAMYYSFKKYAFTLDRHSGIKVLKRTLVIYFIGLLLNAFPYYHVDLSHLRLMGVLPRIAVAYGLSSLIILGFRTFYIKIITASILIAYWILLMTLGTADPYSLNGNFAGTFDAFIMGSNHLQHYSGATFDLTGLFSTMPSIATVLLGFLAGTLIDFSEVKGKTVIKIIVYGLIMLLTALGWNYIFPINKPLWTSSFVLYTCGWAMIILGALLWIIDIRAYKKWAHPMLVFGLNPLFIYVLSSFWADILNVIRFTDQSGRLVTLKEWMFSNIFFPLGGNMTGSLLFAIHMGILFWLVAWYMERKQIFIKI